MTGPIASTEHLEDLLSEPSPAVVDLFQKLDGDLIVLGVAGKMGPTLARMAKRASDADGGKRRIIGVARFSNPAVEAALQRHGAETVQADLLDPQQVAKLPAAPLVVWMGGMKFGTSGQASLTWAMNTHAPALICERYKQSQIVAFSSGNVYGLSPVVHGGSIESDPLHPVGEYAMSAVGRERIFEYFSNLYRIPMVLLRLNYAVEMRYGVLVDIARQVFRGEPINVSMGAFNAIWQGDANSQALLAFGHLESPAKVLNITGPETLSVRRIAERFAVHFDRSLTIVGEESPNALLNNAEQSHRLFGYPRVSVDQMIEWIADWVQRGGDCHEKPTHFEKRDGKF